MAYSNPELIVLKVGVVILLIGFVWRVVFAASADLSKAGEDALIIDVRTAGEFAGGHVAGAVNLPLNEIEAKIHAIAPDQDQSIILYCLSGARSASAKRLLDNAGYTQVINGGSLRQLKKALSK